VTVPDLTDDPDPGWADPPDGLPPGLPPAGPPEGPPGDGGLVLLPAFDVGGLVEQTGLAVLHEGEYVVPAPGSRARIRPPAEPAGEPVTYTFPVEVEVVGGLTDEHLRTVTRHVFDELDTALRAQG
jgi:hypothetical protein